MAHNIVCIIFEACCVIRCMSAEAVGTHLRRQKGSNNHPIRTTEPTTHLGSTVHIVRKNGRAAVIITKCPHVQQD